MRQTHIPVSGARSGLLATSGVVLPGRFPAPQSTVIQFASTVTLSLNVITTLAPTATGGSSAMPPANGTPTQLQPAKRAPTRAACKRLPPNQGARVCTAIVAPR